jgi:hypothetical protein
MLGWSASPPLMQKEDAVKNFSPKNKICYRKIPKQDHHLSGGSPVHFSNPVEQLPAAHDPQFNHNNSREVP